MEKKAKQWSLIKKSEYYHEVALYPMGVLMVLALVTIASPVQGSPEVANGLMVDGLLALGWFGWCYLQAFRTLRQANRLTETPE
jgi:hypothetical protein